MIGIDPHKGSHTAVAVGAAEEPLGKLRVRACPAQAEKLVAWARAWPERTWAVEGAAGLGHPLAQQLVAAGERVLDVQPKLAARVRLLQTGNTGKSDPNDALSVAVAALRSSTRRDVIADDQASVLKVRAKRHRDLSRARNQAACRLHALLCELIPGGVPDEITAGQAARLLTQITPSGAVAEARCELTSGSAGEACSCSRASSWATAGETTSGRVDSIWPSFTNMPPASSSASRAWRAGLAARPAPGLPLTWPHRTN